MGEFKGFGPKALEFLTDLKNHNNKAWFDENKPRYEANVREPARAFIRDMGKRLPEISEELTADDRRSGGSLMRIYRDVRFGKDKTPYKTNIGIQFRHRLGKDVHAPGAYVHLGLDGCFLGMGMWRPDSKSLFAIRRAIVSDRRRWTRVTESKRLLEHWSPSGDSLKRAPRGFDKDDPALGHLKRKDHILISDLSIEEAESPALVALALERFSAAKEFTALLCDAIGVAF